jgi:hypothetical protein
MSKRRGRRGRGQLHAVQASESSQPFGPRYLDWQGERFKLADKIGLMPVIIFGKLASQGMDTTDLGAVAVMYDLLEQCLDTAQVPIRDSEDSSKIVGYRTEWTRFQDHATRVRADAEDLLDFVKQALERMGKDRTGPSSASSSGPASPSTLPNSQDSLRRRVAEDLKGRPDLQLAVLNAGRNLDGAPSPSVSSA